jgi:hypothetical protein
MLVLSQGVNLFPCLEKWLLVLSCLGGLAEASRDGTCRRNNALQHSSGLND